MSLLGDLLGANSANADILARMLLALVLGGIVGIERTLHGRPAGFRTHALVALASCLLMLVTVYEARWFPEASQARVTMDPTRMAQGIMTGIGFLGAGAILREGMTVRGLTTAASIWITAAIGVLVGIGFLFPAITGASLTLATLAVLRWIEDRLNTPFQARVIVRCDRGRTPPAEILRKVFREQGFTMVGVGYRVDSKHDWSELRLVASAGSSSLADDLVARLSSEPGIRSVRLASMEE